MRSEHAAHQQRLQLLIDEYQSLEKVDRRSADEIIGYDAYGLPT